MKAKFEDLINGPLLVLVAFHALWCGPCKAMAPVLQELAKDMKGKVRIIKIDVDKNQSLATQYGVRGVPTLALFNMGKLIWKESGRLSKQELLTVINSHS